MSTFLSIIGIALYLLSTLWLALRLRGVSRGGAATPKGGLLGLWLAAVLVHGGASHAGILTPEGINLGFLHAASSVAWLMNILLLAASLKRPLESLGIVLLPLGALTLGLEHGLPEIPFAPESVGVGLKIHIFISLLAYSLLSLATLQALVLAMQNRHLHNHHPGGILRALPPLQHMESLLFQMITVGFVLLGVALVTGFIYLDDIFAQHQVHKTVLSITAWVIFAILLWGRVRFGWRGRTAIRWTLGGFVFLMLAYFGSKLVLEIVLQR